MPPATVAGATTSIAYQKNTTSDRRLQQVNTLAVKQQLADLDIPVIPGPSHIVPALVGDAAAAKEASDLLLEKHGIYVQSINYPTVARGEERLRITPTPGHTVQQQQHLASALNSVWDELKLKRTSDWALIGGRCGVGAANHVPVPRIWSDEQLGLLDGTAPVALNSTDAATEAIPANALYQRQSSQAVAASA